MPRPPITVLVVLNPETDEITVTTATEPAVVGQPAPVPPAPKLVAGLLRAAAMEVAWRNRLNSNDSLVEFLERHPRQIRAAAGLGSTADATDPADTGTDTPLTVLGAHKAAQGRVVPLTPRTAQR